MAFFKNIPNLLLAFYCLLLGGISQQVQAQLSGNGEPEPLGKGINTEYEELAPRLSADGRLLFFVRGQHPGNVGGRSSQDIWVAKKLADGSWSTAENIGAPLNNQFHNSIGAVGANGEILLLNNAYGDPSVGISRSVRKNGRWQTPTTIIPAENIPSPANYLSFCSDLEMSAIVLTMADAGGKEDLFVTFRTAAGSWTPPITLGEDINTAGFETSPFLARDGMTLFFASDGHGGEGGADIFMTRRLDESWQSWSTPVNLGPGVNTPGFDAHFILDGKGEMAYFVSGESPTAMSDIYRISASQIPALNNEIESETADTLLVAASPNRPTPISLAQYGIADSRATLCSSRSLDGPGKIILRREAPHFTYRPANDFTGQEILEITHCDPPHSDDCNRVIVIATVSKPTAVVPPKYITLRTRTPQNTPVKLDLGGNSAAVTDVDRTNAAHNDAVGIVAKNSETGGEHIFYRPAPNVTGTDTINLYMHCDKPRDADCILAQVIVDVYQDAASVTPEPIPVSSSDPAPVAVPTPEPIVKMDPRPEPVIAPKATSPQGDILVTGAVTDEASGNPISAELTFFALPANQVLGKIQSNPETGAYALRLPAGVQYSILAKENYHFDASSLVPASATDELVRDLALAPLPTEVGTVFRLDNVYFDVAKATLKPESRTELTRLYDFLKANPTVRIKINGHTDSQSDDAYNLTLSRDRARAVMNYLKYKGVMGTRLDAEGFGETQPVAPNETEEGRALNRRVEFVITQK